MKRKEKGTRGCPFKGGNVVQPNTSAVLVKTLHEWGNRRQLKASRKRHVHANQGKTKDFRLSHKPMKFEETQREKEHQDIK
ncbi:Hypothetical predicted protein, partial [Paramuricea clavata]